MTEEEKQELYENICNDFNCGTFILAPQYVDKLLTKYLDASNVTQEAVNEKQKEQLTKAKEIITRFVMASVYFNGKEADLVEEAEQFLKE